MIDEKILQELSALGIAVNHLKMGTPVFYNGDKGPCDDQLLELKSCPCCNEDTALVLVRMYNRWGWRVECQSCGLKTKTEPINWPRLRPIGEGGIACVDESTRLTSAQAAEIVIKTWNRRPASAV